MAQPTEQDFIKEFKRRGMSDADIHAIKSGQHPLLKTPPAPGVSQQMNPGQLQNSPYQQNPPVQAAPTQATQQQPQLADLLKKIQPTAGQSIANAMSVLGGGKTIYDNGNNLDKQYKLAQIQALQNKQTNLIPIMDEAGNITGYQQTPNGNIKFAPVGYSPVMQEKAKAQTEAARATIPLKEAQTEGVQQGNDFMQQNMSGNGGNVPVGSTFSRGGLTIPLNPVLNNDQMSAVAGNQALEPIVQKIESQLQKGILDSKLGNIGRTLRAGMADSKNYLLTSLDPKLQAFQSDLNTLKKTLPFTEGGKQLTPFEAQQVFALLNITGKSNEQITSDIGQALSILRAKENLALGGRNAALNQQNGQQQPANNDPLGVLS